MISTSTNQIDKEILEFIATNKIASVCCAANNIPHCFNCFYSVLPTDNCLVFKSSPDSRHIKMIGENNVVAGTIISSEISLAKVQGIQFEGVVVAKGAIGMGATQSYYLRYPFAIAVPGVIWVLELHTLKYTNTTNGIKHKAEWERA